MINYKIQISKSAEKQLHKLAKPMIRRVAAAILALSIDPFPVGCKKLRGYENIYRIRIADYRVIYEIIADMITIKVLKIGHRKDIYR